MSKFKQENMSFLSSFSVLVYFIQCLYRELWWVFVFEIKPCMVSSMDYQGKWKNCVRESRKDWKLVFVLFFLLFPYFMSKMFFSFFMSILSCNKSEKVFTCIIFKAVTQKFCRKLSQGTLLHSPFWWFFYTWLYNISVRHSVRYVNLCYYFS